MSVPLCEVTSIYVLAKVCLSTLEDSFYVTLFSVCLFSILVLLLLIFLNIEHSSRTVLLLYAYFVLLIVNLSVFLFVLTHSLSSFFKIERRWILFFPAPVTLLYRNMWQLITCFKIRWFYIHYGIVHMEYLLIKFDLRDSLMNFAYEHSMGW